MRLYRIVGPITIPIEGSSDVYTLTEGYKAYLEVSWIKVGLMWYGSQRQPTSLTKKQVKIWAAEGLVERVFEYPWESGHSGGSSGGDSGAGLVAVLMNSSS